MRLVAVLLAVLALGCFSRGLYAAVMTRDRDRTLDYAIGAILLSVAATLVGGTAGIPMFIGGMAVLTVGRAIDARGHSSTGALVELVGVIGCLAAAILVGQH
jgi:hypothetical protein